LGKSLPPGDDYAESWEIVDRHADQSVVAEGPLAGVTLGQLVRERGPELLGRHAPQPRFPLLFKFLDATRKLSVQVHPSDEQAARLQPPDLGKTEAWVILAAEPGSVVYAGLKRGFDRAAFERELSRGTAELCLHRIEPQPGDCVFVPAGLVHALGAGLVVAEIQQSSDTTYRLFDWNRVGPDGQPRALHIPQGLAATDFQLGPAAVRSPQATSRPFVERLVECEKFMLDRWRWSDSQTLAGDERCHILVLLHGAVEITGDFPTQLLHPGETRLLPASAGIVHLSAEQPAVLLDIYLP
jgi:mannose-6-phosphate isomerase